MAVKLKAFLALERSLSGRVAAAVRQVLDKVLPPIYDKLRQDDVEAAYKLANNLDLTPVIRRTRDYVRYVSYATVMFGAAHLNRKIEDAAIIGSGKLDPVVGRTTMSFASAIINSVGDTVRDLLFELIGAHDLGDPATNFAPSDGITVLKANILRPYVEFQNPVVDAAQRMVQLISALHTSRLAAYGYTEEAHLLDMEEYAITEQLDNRICPVCEVMHGKVFRVEDARRLLDRVLITDNPEDLRTLQPWPSQKKSEVELLRAMSNDEIVARGWHIPPYHPWCRGQLVPVGKVPRIEDTPSFMAAFPEAPIEQTMERPMVETFQTLGLDLTPEQVHLWQTEMREPPDKVLSLITGLTPKEMADQAFDPISGVTSAAGFGLGMELLSTEWERLRAIFSLHGEFFGMKELEARLHLWFESSHAYMYLEELGLSSVGSLPEVLGSWVGAAQALHIDHIEMLADTDPTGRLWVDYGALPEEVDWYMVRDQLKWAIGKNDVKLSNRERGLVLPLLERIAPETLWELVNISVPPVTKFLQKSRLRLTLDLKDPDVMARFVEIITSQ